MAEQKSRADILSEIASSVGKEGGDDGNEGAGDTDTKPDVDVEKDIEDGTKDDKDKVEDNTVADIDSKADDGSKSISKNQLEKLTQSHDKIQEILDANDLDLEDLDEALKAGKTLKSLIGDKDEKALKAEFEAAEKLRKYEEYWAKQDEKKKRESEDESETVKRLEKERQELREELRNRDLSEQSRKQQKAQALAEKQALDKFNTTVTNIIDDHEIADNVKPFVQQLLGVDNPANQIDIDSKVQTKKMAKDGVKLYKEWEQIVIKNYLDGKIKTPKVPDNDNKAPVNKKKEPQNRKEARSMISDFIKDLKKK